MAEVTDEQRKGANNQKQLANYNAESTKNQLSQQLENYNLSDQQNLRQSKVQKAQNSRQAESDRFDANRDLQNSVLGIMGSMGNAMNGSSTGNLMRMIENRNDRDNNTYWTQLQNNQDAVQNAYDEALNQNQIARNDAIINTEKALRDMQGDLAANLNNINPDLFEIPGTNETDLGATNYYNNHKFDANNAVLSGYLTPENSVQAARQIAARNRLAANDYFSQLINRFNRRY